MGHRRTYYLLHDDVYIPGRWHLRNPLDVHGQILYLWTLFEGTRFHIDERIFFPVNPNGIPLDFSEGGPMIPVVHARVIKLLQELEVPDLQFIPVTVEGYPADYSILNVMRVIPCVDEARCARVERFTAEDGFPKRVGEYRVIEDLHIDPMKVGDARMFRIWGWPMLTVSNDIKEAFEQARLLGPKFKQV